MNFDFEKNKKLIIIILAVLFIVFVLIRIVVTALNKDNNKNNTNNETNTSITSEATNTAKNQERLKKLKKVSEAERIRIYLGEYFKFLENKDYESAYQLLYADFKQSYFPTLEKYKEYIEKCKYSRLLGIDYNDINAMGHYYIVTLNIKNIAAGESNSGNMIKEDTKFVVKEDDYDEFYLSFQL